MEARLTWRKYIEQRSSKFMMIISQLNSLIGRYVPSEKKLLIYKTVLRHILTYEPVTWLAVSDVNITALEVLRSMSLRQVINTQPFISNGHIHNDLKMSLLQKQLAELAAGT